MDNEYVQIVSSTSFLKNNLTSLLLQYLQYKKEQETLKIDNYSKAMLTK